MEPIELEVWDIDDNTVGRRKVYFEFNGSSLRVIFDDQENGPDIWIAADPDGVKLAIHPDGESDPTCYIERKDGDGEVTFMTDHRTMVTVNRDGELV